MRGGGAFAREGNSSIKRHLRNVVGKIGLCKHDAADRYRDLFCEILKLFDLRSRLSPTSSEEDEKTLNNQQPH